MRFAKGGNFTDMQALSTGQEEFIIPNEHALRIFGLNDIVQVVRCKDCKHLERDSGLQGGKMCLVRGDTGWCNDTDFCSYGERKADG